MTNIVEKMASLSGEDSDNATQETVSTRTRARRSTAKSPRRGRKKGPQSRPTRSSGRKQAQTLEVEDEEQIEEMAEVSSEQVEGARSPENSDTYERMEVDHHEYVVEEDVGYEDVQSGEVVHEENGMAEENGDVESEAEKNNVDEDGFGNMEDDIDSNGEEIQRDFTDFEDAGAAEEVGGGEEVEEEDGSEEAAVVAALEKEDLEKEEASTQEDVGEEVVEGDDIEEEEEEDGFKDIDDDEGGVKEEETREEETREDDVGEVESAEAQEEVAREADAGSEEEGSEEAAATEGQAVDEEFEEGVSQPASELVGEVQEEEGVSQEVVMDERNKEIEEHVEEPAEVAEEATGPASPEPEVEPEKVEHEVQDSNSMGDTIREPEKMESVATVSTEVMNQAGSEDVQEDGQKKRKRKTRFSFDAEGEVSLDAAPIPTKRVARGDGDSAAIDVAEVKKPVSPPRRAEPAPLDEENSRDSRRSGAEYESTFDADSEKKKSKSKKQASTLKEESRPVAVKRMAAVASGVGATAAALLAEAAAAAKASMESDASKKKSGSKSQKRKVVMADGDTYDPSSPTSENSCDETPAKRASREKQEREKKRQQTGNSSASSSASGGSSTGSTAAPEKAKKALPELEKYWKAVKEDPSDFTGWTYLLQYVDQENDVEAAREAYDSFLAYYPYCYGYWRKYAEYEKRKGHKQRCQEVFERGLKAIPLSVDLWIHYLNFCKVSAYVDDEEAIRQQFENGIAACGIEFRSDRLWENYIKWETEGKRLQNVTAIYDRVLHIPTQSYATHFENFMSHIMNHPPQKVLSVDEFLSLRREVLQQLKQNDASLAPSEVHPPAPGADDDDAPPGMEDAPPGDDEDALPVVPKATSVRSDEETTALREKVIALRKEIHKNTRAMVAARWNYEEGIKRPYFHVKPLERCQLKNWKEYLDFEIEQGDQGRIITLFERCLIPCALYEEFWIRFVRYLEAMGEEMVEKVRDVYHRACTIHHTKKPTLHLYWAAFEESQGNYEKAAEILTNLEKIMPNLLQVAYRLINLERRRGNLDSVCSLYEHYISTSKNKTVATNMAIKYARFCWKVMDDVEKAVKILRDELDKEKENARLYLQLIDMALQRNQFDEKEVIAIFDEFLSKDGIETEQKVLFAQRKVEFLEDFGMDIMSVQKAYDEFQRFTKMAKDRKKKSSDPDKGDGHSKKKGSSADASQSQQQGSASSQSPGQSATYQQQAGQTAGAYKSADYAASGTSTVSTTAASGQYTQPPYPAGQYPPPQQGPPPPYGGQAPYPAGQYNQTTDPNYPGYQNWGYSQTGYGYNQGWGGYNYY
ncbi:pre-mRNA-processing factor 39 [Ischnura elegans]|uniref:pre-mRNA-processing factor 39 n=1 Tax=Ischnura elegans TaxID=197161 RepID=UPI001ED8B067|nr:pre-mRNA-processing factor 39 [Ischnura elegans]